MIKRFLGPIILFTIIVIFFLFPFTATWMNKSLSELTIKNSPQEPWFLKEEKAKYVLVYFGYVGCTTICIPSLNEIQKLYKKIDEKKINLPFYFVNIDPKLPSNLPEHYIKSIDSRFHGIYNDYQQLNKLKQDFNLAIQESKIEISHSSNLYLFKKENEKYKLYKIYITHPYDEELLLKALQN